MPQIKKVYISQSLNGMSQKEFVKKRDKAIQKLKMALKEYDVEILKIPYNKEHFPNVRRNYVWNLGKSLEIMSDADIVFFLDEWKTSAKCRVEHEVAISYGYLILYERDLDYIDLNEVK